MARAEGMNFLMGRFISAAFSSKLSPDIVVRVRKGERLRVVES